MENALEQLSSKLGILDSFKDPSTGLNCVADTESKIAICQALGYASQTEIEALQSLKRLEKETWFAISPSTIAVSLEELKPLIFEMCLPVSKGEQAIDFKLIREEGTELDGFFHFFDMPLIEEQTFGDIRWQKRRIYLFLEAGAGYHEFVLLQNAQEIKRIYLIVAPKACYLPPFTCEQKRVFGFPLQLYGLRSDTNWGIGDFSDLAKTMNIANKLGASLVGVNPLSALFPDSPCDASPYCASSRLFLNPLYVDLEGTPEAKTSEKYQTQKSSKAFQQYLKKIRASDQVLYESVAELKEKFFKVLHEEFILKNFNKKKKPITKRGKKYQSFCIEKGERLRLFAAYQLLRKYFLSQGKSAIWCDWEAPFRNPYSEEVSDFCKTYEKEISLIYYQQFVAFEQYEHVIQTIQKTGMPIGLYTDLPVGVSANSAEVWSDQELFLPYVTTGAPPDEFNKKGQDWSLAPYNPKQLMRTGFKAYREMIIQAMRGAGAVRLDHAFGLERLYLRVPNASGAYLKYPYKILMAIIALESHRNSCLVIAEDLGTPPDGFCDKIRTAQALSFKIAHYQQYDGTLLMPQQYDYLSLIATGTHDMASYTAFWKEVDLELALALKTVTEEQYHQHKVNRQRDKTAFVDAFYQQCLPMPERSELDISIQSVPEWFMGNTYLFLSRSHCMIMLVRLEDLLGQEQQINLPGTYLEYPNWRYKLPLKIEELLNNVSVQTICRMIKLERPPFKREKYMNCEK